MTNILNLYAETYDFTLFNTPPTAAYMLASIPRSGSTHLAVQLWKSGVMGAPMEYLNGPFMEAMRQRLGTEDDFASYWSGLKRVRNSRNGVFGYKMFVSDYVRNGKKDPELLCEITPDKVIFLTRSNRIEQAVSYSKAIRSGAWFHGVRMSEKPVYDADNISYCLAALEYQNDFWNKLFALTETAVHSITYESLLADPVGVVNGVADFLNVEVDGATVVDLPCLKTQRDAESAEWARRYEEDSAKSAQFAS